MALFLSIYTIQKGVCDVWLATLDSALPCEARNLDTPDWIEQGCVVHDPPAWVPGLSTASPCTIHCVQFFNSIEKILQKILFF